MRIYAELLVLHGIGNVGNVVRGVEFHGGLSVRQLLVEVGQHAAYLGGLVGRGEADATLR